MRSGCRRSTARRRCKLAGHVVNGSGETEKWLDIAASDSGRIVAVRIVPGRISRASWFKVWEPDGTSTVEGPLTSPTGWTTYIYPLGFDLTADGRHMVYGFYNSSYGYPISPHEEGIYVRPVTNSPLDPIKLTGWEDPTIVGDRVIAHSGSDVYVQRPGTPYADDFDGWIGIDDPGWELNRTDVAANGQLLAYEAEQWNGTQTGGKIGVFAIQGIDQVPDFPGAVNCYVPASGVAKEASVSQDARSVAWTDAGGLKVAGAPTTAADPCVMGSAPVVISPTGHHGAIGGANIAAFLPPVAPPPPPVTSGPPTGGAAAPVANIPAKVKFPAAGLGVKVAVSGAGKVTITATVPAKAMGKKGKPVVIGTGNATAKAAGTVTVKLRLNKAAKKRLKKLKGTKMTLKIVQNGRTTTKTVTLR